MVGAGVDAGFDVVVTVGTILLAVDFAAGATAFATSLIIDVPKIFPPKPYFLTDVFALDMIAPYQHELDFLDF